MIDESGEQNPWSSWNDYQAAQLVEESPLLVIALLEEGGAL